MTLPSGRKDRQNKAKADTAALRVGQKAFNDLYDRHPEIANAIRGTVFDPFHNDSAMPEFKIRVAQLLKEKRQ